MNQDKQRYGFLIVVLVLLVVSQIIPTQMTYMTISFRYFLDTFARLFGGIALLIIIHIKGYILIDKKYISIRKLTMILLPALLIAINNFPISAYIAGRTTLGADLSIVLLFVGYSLSVGFLEEIVFRGVVLLLFLQILEKNKHKLLLSVIFTAVLFGLSHILNLFAGAAVGPTLLQVGYSTLVGAMWGVIYIMTKNIAYPIILHALYNFFGQVLFELGSVTNRYDEITIVITTVLGIITFIYYLYVFIQYTKETT